MPRALARFNRVVTNPVLRHVAGWAPGFAIIEHTGRKSSAAYRTPVNAFAGRDGTIVVPINYGEQSDWLRNLLAAGGGHVTRRRRLVAATEPTIVRGAEAMALLPAVVRTMLRPFGIDAVVVITPEWRSDA